MGLKGGKKTKTTTVEKLPAWVTQAAQSNLSLANSLTAPFLENTPDYMVAPFNEDQLNSFDIARNFAGGQSQITADDLGRSHYQTIANRGPYTLSQVGGVPTVNVTPNGGGQGTSVAPVAQIAAQKFTDANINDYMNPYTQSVVDSSMNDLRDEYSRSQALSDLQQAAGGAFGGGRHGIRDAQVTDDYLRNVSRTSSGLRNQAFNTAAGLIQGDQNRALQAAQANQQANLQRSMQETQLRQQQAQLRHNAAVQNANLAMQGRMADLNSRYQSDRQSMDAVGQMANAAMTAQQLADQRTLQNAELLGAIGLQQQQQDQALADVPFKALDYRINALRGTPYGKTTVQTTKTKNTGLGGAGRLLGGAVGTYFGGPFGGRIGSSLGGTLD